MWPRALVIAVRWLLRPSRLHAKGSRRERHDAALAPVPRRVRVTRGFDEIVLLVSAFSELPTRHLFSDAVRWKYGSAPCQEQLALGGGPEWLTRARPHSLR